MTTNRITITGKTAVEIHDLTASITLGSDWTEVYMTDTCGHGCKLYARTGTAYVEYAVIHSSTYGCPQGRDMATAVVDVMVEGTDDAEQRSAFEADTDAAWADVEAGEQFDRDDAAMRQAEADTQADRLDYAARDLDAYEIRDDEDEIEYADESEYIDA